MNTAKKNVAAELLESMDQALKIARGELQGKVTKMQLPPPPPAYQRTHVSRLRSQLNMTQNEFAQLLNVSRATVESWEQGVRKPSGGLLRLLQIIEDPKALEGFTQPSPSAARSGNPVSARKSAR